VADEPLPGKAEDKTPTARERMAKGWANLRPVAPGEVRNKLGINGREGAEAWRRYLDKPDPDEPDFESRRDVMHGVLYKALKKGKLGALQMGIEQDQGKPPQSIDHKSSDRSMSPYGADSVSSKLRAELAALTAEEDEEQAEAPADDGAPK
jgi:hypothetical protein